LAGEGEAGGRGREEKGKRQEREEAGKGRGRDNGKIRADWVGLGIKGGTWVYYREFIHSRSRSYDDTNFSRRWG
jgi:hypothetical protein